MKAIGPGTERETIIQFSDGDDNASIWTASQTVYNRLVKRKWFPSEDGERHAIFVIPKSRIKLPTQKSTRKGRWKPRDNIGIEPGRTND